MRNGIKESGFQALPFACRFRFTELFDGACAFESDSDHGAERFQGLAGKQTSRNTQASDRTRSHSHRNERETAARVSERLLALRGQLQLFIGEMRRGAGMIELLFVLEVQSRRAYFKGFNDMIRNCIEQRDDVAGNQELLTEEIQPLHLTAALLRFVGFAADARGKLAGDKRRRQKSEQCSPILGGGDSKRAHRREKEVN